MWIVFIVLIALLGSLKVGACAGPDGYAIRVSLSDQVGEGDSFMGIRLLGVLQLPAIAIDGMALDSLSGLAWDEDADLLYALSDTGKLFHLRPQFSDGRLRDVQVLTAYVLHDANGRSLKASWADSEGLAIENGANGIPGDSQLIVSFEGQPRIARYSPTGKWLGEESLPAMLEDVERYAHSNRTLEAVTWHPGWGILTAPERPLQEGPVDRVPICALTGRCWVYPLYKAPNSALVAIETLPDGSLLTLERAFVSLLRPLVIALRRTRLPDAPEGPLTVEDVAVFDTSRGWLLDNFEGLTHHRSQRFFMISDDNSHFLQSTLLVYFERVIPNGISAR